MSVPATVLLIASFLLLAVFGAGTFVWSLCLTAVVTAGAYCVAARRSAIRFPAIERCFLVILILVLLTVVPFPPGTGLLTGSRRHDQNARVTASFEKAHQLGLIENAPRSYAMTRNQPGTRRVIMLIIAAFASTMLGATLSIRHKHAYLRFLCLVGLVIAVTGHIGQWRIPQGDTFWWLFPVTHGLPGPVACFMNPNHFAGFVAMLCPAVLAFLVNDFRERRWLRAVLGIPAFAAMSLVIVFSMSRGAVLAYGAGLLVVTVLFFLRHRVAGVFMLLVLCCVLAGIVSVPHSAVRERLKTIINMSETASLKTRMSVARDSFSIWRHYPVAGTGLNAFRMTFPQHRTTSAREYMVHADNEYVQLLVETGVIGIFLAAVLAAATVRNMATSFRAAPSGPITVAVWGGLAVAATHAFCDSPLHTPLYSVTLASMIGLTLTPPPASEHRNTAHNAPRIPWTPLACLVASLFLGAGWKSMQRGDSHSLVNHNIDKLARRMVWTPTSWRAWCDLGSHACANGTPAARRFGESCISRALEYDPNNYVLLKYAGEVRLSIGDREGAREAFAGARELRSWLPLPEVPGE